MFFEQFWQWLQAQLLTYVGTQTATLAAAIEPAAVALGTLYVMVWGYLHLQGRIQEPVMDGVKRILTLAVVLAVGLRLWLFNDVIVDTFYRAPAQLAAVIAGAPAPLATLDTVWQDGGAVAGQLWSRGAVLTGDLGFYVAGAVVWALVGGLCVYALFLMALSQIALAVLLALGPLFIVLLLFEGTKRFFELWLAQLANYALVTVLTILVTALILQVVRAYAAQTAALGAAVMTVDALNLLLVTGLALLILRQVPSMAAGLSRGVGLAGFHVMSRAMGAMWQRSTRGVSALGSAMTVSRGASGTARPARRLAPAAWRRGPGR